MNTDNDIDGLVSSFLGELAALSLELKTPLNSGVGTVPGEKTSPIVADHCSKSSHTGEMKCEDSAGLVPLTAYNGGYQESVSVATTSMDRGRARSLDYIAGGDPRVCRILSALLARELSDPRIESLLQILDRRLGSVPGAVAFSEEDDAVILLLRAWALYKTGMHEQALLFCDKSIQLDPDFVPSWCHRGLILLLLGRSDEALHSCEQALELDPDDAFAWVSRGKALDVLERRNEALEAFEKAVSLGEDSLEVHYKRAEILLGLNRWREGIALLDETLGPLARSAEPDAGDTVAIITGLLPCLLDPPGVLQALIKALFLVYRKHNMLRSLGMGLLHCIPDVVSPGRFGDEEVCRWRDSWQEIAGGYSQFAQPLRLLCYAVDYRKNKNPRILMSLPEEERTALERLIGIGR